MIITRLFSPLSPSRLYLHLLFLSAVVILFFIPTSESTLWWSTLADSAHVILFCAISVQLFIVLHALRPEWSDLLLVTVVVLMVALLGAAIECLQGSFGRQASLLDFINNGYGLIAGISFTLSYRAASAGNRSVAKFLYASIGVVSIFVGMLPLLLLAQAYQQRDDAYPVIMDLSADWSSRFVRLNRSELVPAEVYGSKSVGELLRFLPAKYPGVSLIEPVADWSRQEAMVFDVWSPYEEELILNIRIHDAAHDGEYEDRFNRALPIRAGLNTIRISIDDIRNSPTDRVLNMEQVAGVIMFLKQPDAVVELELGVIRLH